MQRAAQRDVRAPKDQRAKRLRRALVCAAAVPAVLITAACSSDSGDGGAKDGGSAARGGDASARATGGASADPSASASPAVPAAAYRALPKPCAVLSKGALGDLVPKAGTSGKEGRSDDSSTRGSCSWSSLDNKGVKGSQFRWLNVSLLRFDSDANRGSGDAQAHTYFTQQVKDAQGVSGAKSVKWEAVAGTGDEATAVRYDLKKKEGAFKEQTVVTRVENVVVTVDYNGAGLAGEKTPDASDLTKAAEKAAKEAVAAVSAANGKGSGAGSGSGSADPGSGKDGAKSSGKPSATATEKGAGGASKAPSGGASPSTSASESAAAGN
ncbi:DUF3558 domain-containing protein [Streptomyces sp. J2-1]|uniref:DUF3558 domain-containing protein n=1 Tax=Streptomyces corallincola TaxID=2851888 RepID=UPI001C38E445|nr:DUF3558 domain-containing protein [Streptomyces corallincola]MBV2354979.1 DUF3558 domain-containing protein [Streptomyces corallincola]